MWYQDPGVFQVAPKLVLKEERLSAYKYDEYFLVFLWQNFLYQPFPFYYGNFLGTAFLIRILPLDMTQNIMGSSDLKIISVAMEAVLINDQLQANVFQTACTVLLHRDIFFFSPFFFFFNGCTCDLWKFLCQGLNQICSCHPTPQPWQHPILAVSATYAGSLTH